MIRHLEHKAVDKAKWDRCIERSANSLIYAYSWYLDVVSPGWEALVLDDYTAVMPLTCRTKYGIRYLYQPFFTQQLGVFSPAETTEIQLREFLDAIPEKFRFIEINLNQSNTFPLTGIQVKKNLNHELELGRPYPELFRAYSENTRRNIRKAGKHELVLKKDAELAGIITLFRQNRGREVKELKARDYAVLSELVGVCRRRGRVQVWGVLSGRRLCAGAVFVSDGRRSIFLFSGLSAEGKEKGAMPFLIDHYIREYCGKDIILDFEGSNDRSLARFYKGFGSKECVYLQVRKNRLPRVIRWLKK
ncbi:MAG: GNAT family N-acetyltransferase [Bacteroidota bacterium]